MSSDRVHVPDPDLMRRAGRRMIWRLVVLLLLTSLLASWGISLMAHGEISGLPLAAAGVVPGVAGIVLVISTRRIRRTLDGDTVSRAAMLAARRVAHGVRTTVLAIVLALLTFGLLRAVTPGEWWTMLITVPVSAVLLVLAGTAKRLAKAQDRSLAG
ncbi:hypothetical protein [Actinoplanes sp. NPDC026619]|uniref:hypothetical protein n=1 Tax=Actinoplanes sp. NPDC026619 TaxID=3155798 RepID=UPI0033FC1583